MAFRLFLTLALSRTPGGPNTDSRQSLLGAAGRLKLLDHLVQAQARRHLARRKVLERRYEVGHISLTCHRNHRIRLGTSEMGEILAWSRAIRSGLLSLSRISRRRTQTFVTKTLNEIYGRRYSVDHGGYVSSRTLRAGAGGYCEAAGRDGSARKRGKLFSRGP
jgi:hypothetical protein